MYKTKQQIKNTAIYTQQRRESLRGKARGNDETKELEAERFNKKADGKEKKRKGVANSVAN